MDDRNSTQLLELYKASLILSGVGDAMGFKNGKWEFEYVGGRIHTELERMGGLDHLYIKYPDWIVSDDTVMHLATTEALVKYGEQKLEDKKQLYSIIAERYIECMEDMSGRAPGPTCINNVRKLDPTKEDGYFIPFDPKGGGCGAAMRSMSIGLYYSREDELDDLIAVSIESGRMTHNNPTGYLGSLASALFTHYAIREKHVQEWGAGLMSILPKAWDYVKSQNRDVKENEKAWSYFKDQWAAYLELRGITDGFSMPQFPDVYGVPERDKFYKSVSFSGWGGSSGHDAPMIAYDALLGSGNDWKELCLRATLHGGDNDSTGAIAAAWFGALYGFEGVPPQHYKDLEYHQRLEKLAEDIFRLRTKKT